MKSLIQLFGDLLSPAGAKGKLSVLIYHRVLANPDPILLDEIDAGSFTTQMTMLRDEFNVLSLGDAVERLVQGALPSRAVCITFDDGYSDNEQVALPILKKLDLVATFFVATGFSNGGMMFNDRVFEAVRLASPGLLDLSALGLGHYELGDSSSRRATCHSLIGQIKYRTVIEREVLIDRMISKMGATLPGDLMMRPSQIRRLYDEGMEIGGHTVNHPILMGLDDDQARDEIVGGKKRLEDIVGGPVKLFAYPNGKPGVDYGVRDVEIVKQAGFLAAVSTVTGIADCASDIFQLPRLVPWDRSPRRFGLRLLGNYLR
jgi:peptidoglycan/xylan/chitin deacetylase (PgdA/CDA1 family)